MALILSGAEITPETPERDWSAIEAPALTAAEQAAIRVEIRIEPMEMADSSTAHEVSVWLRWNDREMEVSSMLPTLTVCLDVDALVNGENRDAFTSMYAIAHQTTDDDTAVTLEGTLMKLPGELTAHRSDTAERFVVEVAEDGSALVTAHEAEASLERYRQDVLKVLWNDGGVYWLQEIK